MKIAQFGDDGVGRAKGTLTKAVTQATRGGAQGLVGLKAIKIEVTGPQNEWLVISAIVLE
jgi:hypothetical protein